MSNTPFLLFYGHSVQEPDPTRHSSRVPSCVTCPLHYGEGNDAHVDVVMWLEYTWMEQITDMHSYSFLAIDM